MLEDKIVTRPVSVAKKRKPVNVAKLPYHSQHPNPDTNGMLVRKVGLNYLTQSNSAQCMTKIASSIERLAGMYF